MNQVQFSKILGTRSLANVNKDPSAQLLSQNSTLIYSIIVFCCGSGIFLPFYNRVKSAGQLGKAQWQWRHRLEWKEKTDSKNGLNMKGSSEMNTGGWRSGTKEDDVDGSYSWQKRHKAMRGKLLSVFCRVRVIMQSRRSKKCRSAGWKS